MPLAVSGLKVLGSQSPNYRAKMIYAFWSGCEDEISLVGKDLAQGQGAAAGLPRPDPFSEINDIIMGV